MGEGEPPTRRRLRWQFVVTALLLVLLAARVALPSVAARALERVMSDALEVEFSVGDVDLDVLEGWVAAKAVTMRVEGAEEDLARAEEILIDADWGALTVGDLRAERIAIEGPRLFFEIDAAGRSNWEALGGTKDATSEPEPGEPERGTFLVTADVLEIGAGTVELVDHMDSGAPDLRVAVGTLQLEGAEIGRKTPEDPVRWALGRAEARDWQLAVTPLGRDALDFAIRANAGPLDEAGSLPLELHLTREDDVELALKGTIRLEPFAFELTMDWKGLSSRSLAPLVLRGADVVSGTSAGTLLLKLDLDDRPDRGLVVTGSVEHDDLVLKVDNEPPIEVEIADFDGEIEEIRFPIPAQASAAPPPIRVAWKRVDLRKPRVELLGATGSAAGEKHEPAAAEAEAPAAPEEEAAPAEVASKTAPKGASAPTDPASDASASTGHAGGEPASDGTADPGEASEPAPAPLVVEIAALSLRNGRVAWHNAALAEHSEQTLSEIDFDASDLHWPPATVGRAKLVIGSLGAKPLRIEGPIRADGAELKVRGSGIKVVPWNPLISYYSDYTITGGSLAIKSDFKLVADSYDAPTTVTIHRIRATTDGSGFQKTFGIPLSTAITLLSDPSGDIDLKIPVSGRLGSGGELQLGVSIVDAMREGIMNALTSVIASPFGIAGSLIAEGRDLVFLRIGEADFEPGAIRLEPAAKEELDRAAAFVAKSPTAKLSLAAEIVAADLEPEAGAKRPNVFRTMVRGGAALFGGRRELDARTYTLALDLAKARLEAAEDHLAESGVLPPERVVQREWDEKVVDGSPRIVLRLDNSRDDDE